MNATQAIFIWLKIHVRKKGFASVRRKMVSTELTEKKICLLKQNEHGIFFIPQYRNLGKKKENTKSVDQK